MNNLSIYKNFFIKRSNDVQNDFGRIINDSNLIRHIIATATTSDHVEERTTERFQTDIATCSAKARTKKLIKMFDGVSLLTFVKPKDNTKYSWNLYISNKQGNSFLIVRYSLNSKCWYLVTTVKINPKEAIKYGYVDFNGKIKVTKRAINNKVNILKKQLQKAEWNAMNH